MSSVTLRLFGGRGEIMPSQSGTAIKRVKKMIKQGRLVALAILAMLMTSGATSASQEKAEKACRVGKLLGSIDAASKFCPGIKITPAFQGIVRQYDDHADRRARCRQQGYNATYGREQKWKAQGDVAAGRAKFCKEFERVYGSEKLITR